MNICLIGGIYGQNGSPSGYLRITPETTLETGLRRAGHQITTASHYTALDFGNFDIVHVHHLSYGAARLASDTSGAPFIFTPHDASEMSGATLGAARAHALSFVLSRADRVVSLSRAEARFQGVKHGVEASRLDTIPNGIDAGVFPFRRENHAGGNRPWQLLFVGQLIPLKGCDLILRVMAALKLDAELTLIYQGADQESELRALASELGIARKVHFRGRLEPGRLAEAYRRSDLLVMASQTEALPSVLTEAMCSGLPFIATDVGGIREQTAGFGYLLERRSVECLSAGIARVLGQYPRFAAEGAAMSRHARDTYSTQAMIDRHVALYESAAGLRPRRLGWRRAAANAIVRAAVRRLGAKSTSATPIEVAEHSTATERP